MKKILVFYLLPLIIGCTNFNNLTNDYFLEIKKESDFDILINEMKNHNLILLGESTHGTKEYYEYRSIISKKLIEKHDFNFIAVEGDWNSIYELNLYVKGLSDKKSAYDVLKTFDRWPTWMWANKQVEELAEWLKEYNDNLDFYDKIGIYGFDVYDAEKSLFIVESFLDLEYECLSNFKDDFSDYVYYLYHGNKPCNIETKEIYDLISDENFILDDKGLFNIKQNAFVVKNAEKHYRANVYQDMNSWNERVIHMTKTIEKLISRHGKGIIWAHNTHVGDARATDMINSNSINMGQIFRENNKNIFILGFGTYEGEVIAGRTWAGSIEKLKIPKANENSYEYLFYNLGMNNSIIFLQNENLNDEIKKINNNRAIGVVYNPDVEYPVNYVKTNIVNRYNAFIFIKETNALELLY
jgi:erythromycin esterase